MSYSSIINTAISYFSLLGSFIDDQYANNPAGIVYPESLSRYLHLKKVILTQGAMKANVWVFTKLNSLLDEMDRDYKPLDLVKDSEYIFERYKEITYSQYIFEENMKQLETSLQMMETGSLQSVKGMYIHGGVGNTTAGGMLSVNSRFCFTDE